MNRDTDQLQGICTFHCLTQGQRNKKTCELEKVTETYEPKCGTGKQSVVGKLWCTCEMLMMRFMEAACFIVWMPVQNETE